MVPLDEVFAAIAAERRYQDQHHNTAITKPWQRWLDIIKREVAEAQADLTGGPPSSRMEGSTSQSPPSRDSFLSEVVQIAACCVACLQQHGVGDYYHASLPPEEPDAAAVNDSNVVGH